MTASTWTKSLGAARGRPGGERPSRGVVLTLAGLVLLVAGWWAFALTQPPYSFPGPGETLEALWAILLTSDFWLALGQTFSRAALGFLCAAVIGMVWGAINGTFTSVDYLTRGLLQILMSVPAVVLAILGMVWFGANGTVVVFVVALVGIPVITTSTTEAVRNIDRDLLEMGRLFRLSHWTMLRRIIAPSVVPPILAALTVVTGQSIRAAVMAELLATGSGLGAEIRLAQINIQTDHVFAYAVTLVLVTYLLDTLLIQPVQRRAIAYRDSTKMD